MNVLLLEDRGSVSYYFKDLLESEECTVYDAANVSAAKYYFKEKKIDCLIVDLNLSPEGLKPEEVEKTRDGLLSGWIWLCEYVYKENPALKQRTIILTEYMKELRAHVPGKELDGIFLVEKGSINPAKQVLKHLATIAEARERKDNQ